MSIHIFNTLFMELVNGFIKLIDDNPYVSIIVCLLLALFLI
jgi:hypothetical protein